MNQNAPTLAEAVATYEPAADVTDLDTARRLITHLRERLTKAAVAAAPIEGEFTAFLDDDHTRMLQILYDKKLLGFAGDPNDPYWLDPPELDESFSDFVEEALDVVWDMARIEQDLKLDDGITPSA